MRVLVSAPYMLPVIDRFRSYFESADLEVVIADVEERLEVHELLPYAGEVDGVICGDDRFTSEVFEAFSPRLKVISKWGTGIDSIDQQAAQDYGVAVRNTPGAFTEPVSDSVLGYMLAFARQLPWLDRRMKKVGWEKKPARALHESTLGVIGVGRIGRRVIEKAACFNMTILGNDIREIEPGFLDTVPVEMVSLERLLANSDFISINCDLNPTSRHLIDRERLELARPSAVLINTARGPVVDEQALAHALARGQIAGAALDVFEQEPLPQESPLRAMDNVMLAPHNANASPTAWERVHWNTIGNLFEGLGLDRPEAHISTQAERESGS